MALTVTYVSQAKVVETLADAFVASSDNTLTFNGMDTSATYNAGTPVPVSLHASQRVTMTGGAATIDLRNLTGANGGPVDGNGKKVQIVKLRNKATNASPITFSEGASNGYALFGAGWTLTLLPGQEFSANLLEQAPDISATDKTIDISGTGAEVAEVQFIMG